MNSCTTIRDDMVLSKPKAEWNPHSNSTDWNMVVTKHSNKVTSGGVLIQPCLTTITRISCHVIIPHTRMTYFVTKLDRAVLMAYYWVPKNVNTAYSVMAMQCFGPSRQWSIWSNGCWMWLPHHISVQNLYQRIQRVILYQAGQQMHYKRFLIRLNHLFMLFPLQLVYPSSSVDQWTPPPPFNIYIWIPKICIFYRIISVIRAALNNVRLRKYRECATDWMWFPIALH